MSSAYHMVNYRRFETDGKVTNENTFEALCRSALSKTNGDAVSLWKRAQDRIYDAQDGRRVLLNKVADLKSAVFGELCVIQDKGLQTLLDHQVSEVQLSNITTAEIFKLDERSAPQGSQFIRGMGYWLATGNHLFFVKTQSMTTGLQEDYFKWLLTEQSPVISSNVALNFQAEFDRSQLPNGIGDIRGLKISGKSAPMMVSPVADNGTHVIQTSRTISQRAYEFAQAIPLAQTIFGPARAKQLMESLGPEEYLAVDASVKVRGKRTAQSRQKFRELANELADTSEAQVRVQGKDGQFTDGDVILRTRMPFDLPYEGSNLLDFDNVSDRLQEVYSRFVADKKIRA